MNKSRPSAASSGTSSAGSSGHDPQEREALLGTLTRLGFAAVAPPSLATPPVRADLWVSPSGRHRLVAPVFVESSSADTPGERAEELVARWSQGFRQDPLSAPGASILVVGSEEVAELTGSRMTASTPVPPSLAISRTRILVQPRGPGAAAGESKPHWHRLRVPPKVLLMLATGALIGLAHQSQADGEDGNGVPIDVEGMFRALRSTFLIDVEGSMGVSREEDAMFLLYQLALRETYAPGDQGASLHELVNDPKSPAARLPWFAI